VLFCKSDSRVLDSSGGLVCGISRIGNIFKLISHLLDLLQSVCSLSLFLSSSSSIGD
jgi:hypothetical protein